MKNVNNSIEKPQLVIKNIKDLNKLKMFFLQKIQYNPGWDGKLSRKEIQDIIDIKLKDFHEYSEKHPYENLLIDNNIKYYNIITATNKYFKEEILDLLVKDGFVISKTSNDNIIEYRISIDGYFFIKAGMYTKSYKLKKWITSNANLIIAISAMLLSTIIGIMQIIN